MRPCRSRQVSLAPVVCHFLCAHTQFRCGFMRAKASLMAPHYRLFQGFSQTYQIAFAVMKPAAEFRRPFARIIALDTGDAIPGDEALRVIVEKLDAAPDQLGRRCADI